MQAFRSFADALDESRPAAPVQTHPEAAETPAQTRARRAAARETFLRASGYTILDDGPVKVLKVNRDWIAGGADAAKAAATQNDAKWLLFVDADAPLRALDVKFLDEIETETEEVAVTQTVKYGCATREETKQIRSAYLITQGRAAIRFA